MGGSERDGIEVMSDAGLRVLESHLQKSRKRLGKAFKRMEMHGVDEGIDSRDVEWLVSNAHGSVSMAITNVEKERECRAQDTASNRSEEIDD